ncbi:hypothetical protein [Candidatus Poriferisocius sp.]|uniref:hypothetical protein n=1 Tax=Candidatus Poriferisocius sp. TaxID=3101276 RepID=UPI003B5A15B2
MPELNLTTLVTSIIILLLLALPFLVARIVGGRRPAAATGGEAGPGPGFTYALVPPGGHPDLAQGQERGSWQWCLAFIPEQTADGGTEMPPWWAPAPPWDAVAGRGGEFTGDADALQAVFEETISLPKAKPS